MRRATENPLRFKRRSDKEASLFSLVVKISSVYSIMTLVKSNNLTAPLPSAYLALGGSGGGKTGAQKGSSAA